MNDGKVKHLLCNCKTTSHKAFRSHHSWIMHFMCQHFCNPVYSQVSWSLPRYTYDFGPLNYAILSLWFWMHSVVSVKQNCSLQASHKWTSHITSRRMNLSFRAIDSQIYNIYILIYHCCPIVVLYIRNKEVCYSPLHYFLHQLSHHYTLL